MPPIERFANRAMSLFVLAMLGAVLIPGAAFSQIVISELLADPASDWDGDGEVNFRTDEWVEVYNAGDAIVDLAAYWLRDGTGDEVHLNLSGSLASGEAAIFYGSDAVAWQEANDIGATGLSLNNSGDRVQLLQTVAGQDELALVDEVVFLDHEAEDDRASGLVITSGAWALFDGLNRYDGELPPLGTDCLPTPGVVNDCAGEVAAEACTWGRVKATYRD
jgi:hypothetical protein